MPSKLHSVGSLYYCSVKFAFSCLIYGHILVVLLPSSRAVYRCALPIDTTWFKPSNAWVHCVYRVSNVRVCLCRESVMAEANGKEPIYDHYLLKPYVFFDVSAGRETRQGTGSLRNQVSHAPEPPVSCQSDKFCTLPITKWLHLLSYLLFVSNIKR